MGEDEYQEYLNAVFGMADFGEMDYPSLTQLRDEEGVRVDGCYRTIPATPEY